MLSKLIDFGCQLHDKSHKGVIILLTRREHLSRVKSRGLSHQLTKKAIKFHFIVRWLNSYNEWRKKKKRNFIIIQHPLYLLCSSAQREITADDPWGDRNRPLATRTQQYLQKEKTIWSPLILCRYIDFNKKFEWNPRTLYLSWVIPMTSVMSDRQCLYYRYFVGQIPFIDGSAWKSFP